MADVATAGTSIPEGVVRRAALLACEPLAD